MATATNHHMRRTTSRHRKSRRVGGTQATYPIFSVAVNQLPFGAVGFAGTSSTYARYVGRVGALAVALGFGAAMATGQGLGLGVAYATEGDPTTDTTTQTDTDPNTDTGGEVDTTSTIASTEPTTEPTTVAGPGTQRSSVLSPMAECARDDLQRHRWGAHLRADHRAAAAETEHRARRRRRRGHPRSAGRRAGDATPCRARQVDGHRSGVDRFPVTGGQGRRCAVLGVGQHPGSGTRPGTLDRTGVWAARAEPAGHGARRPRLDSPRVVDGCQRSGCGHHRDHAGLRRGPGAGAGRAARRVRQRRHRHPGNRPGAVYHPGAHRPRRTPAAAGRIGLGPPRNPTHLLQQRPHRGRRHSGNQPRHRPRHHRRPAAGQRHRRRRRCPDRRAARRGGHRHHRRRRHRHRQR